MSSLWKYKFSREITLNVYLGDSKSVTYFKCKNLHTLRYVEMSTPLYTKPNHFCIIEIRRCRYIAIQYTYSYMYRDVVCMNCSEKPISYIICMFWVKMKEKLRTKLKCLCESEKLKHKMKPHFMFIECYNINRRYVGGVSIVYIAYKWRRRNLFIHRLKNKYGVEQSQSIFSTGVL